VHVRVLACYDENEERREAEYMNCPIHVYLDKPLGDRAVIDVDSERELPLFIPSSGKRSDPPSASG
jgi:hypothetical protein